MVNKIGTFLIIHCFSCLNLFTKCETASNKVNVKLKWDDLIWFIVVISEHRWICSSNILLTAALYSNCDILGIYFNSQYVTEGKILKCKTLRIDILGPVELQSNDESFSIGVTNCMQLEFSCRISCFSLISSKCSFLLCGYITFSPKE